jgi:hypothetical protein
MPRAMPRLAEALDALAPTAPRAADALRFIALTGCRRGEALALEWAMIDLRIHDLRHSFASVGVRLGHDLVVIGGLLGHADTATTAGYAHLDQAETQEASQRVGTHLQKVMSPAPRKRLAPRKPTVARDIFHAFVLSRDSLETFCEAHGLTPATFRRGLIKWREVQRAPGARRAAQ